MFIDIRTFMAWNLLFLLMFSGCQHLIDNCLLLNGERKKNRFSNETERKCIEFNRKEKEFAIAAFVHMVNALSFYEHDNFI